MVAVEMVDFQSLEILQQLDLQIPEVAAVAVDTCGQRALHHVPEKLALTELLFSGFLVS